VSQTFLGVRFNCNKCHDHPFEKWTQRQYYEFGSYFARVAIKRGSLGKENIRSFTGDLMQVPGEEIVYLKGRWRSSESRTGKMFIRKCRWARQRNRRRTEIRRAPVC